MTPLRALCLPLALACVASTRTWAQDAHEPQRLGALLSSSESERDDYPLGISWRVPGETATQLALSLHAINRLMESPVDTTLREPMREFLATLPITGRVNIALPDARWLQANPARDPVIAPGHSVIMPPRPKTISVITSRATRCHVDHHPGHTPIDYLRACHGGEPPAIDWIWLAQPDGRVNRFGAAAWNEQAQDEAAPGAWIWAPPRDEHWPQAFSDAFIALLASQGPALDAGQHARTLYPATRLAPPAAPATQAAPLDFTRRTAPLSPSAPELTAPALTAPAPSRPTEDMPYTPGDWGGIGLLQTPSARMAALSDLRFAVSRVVPYTRINVFAQPFDWLEAGFRYTTISNRLYGSEDFSGDQSYKDKSLDVKFRLLEESAYRPALAAGFRDVTGTGLFSGEYLVANKRWGLIDASLGLMWGYGSGSQGMKNPLAILSPRFERRGPSQSPQGGQFSFSNYFAGPASPFAGLQLRPSGSNWLLKLEYDSNDYQAEPLQNNQPARSRWNAGVTWQASRSVDLSAGFERGNTLMFALNFHAPMRDAALQKTADAGLPTIERSAPTRTPDWRLATQRIEDLTKWRIAKLEQDGPTLRATVDDGFAPYTRDRSEIAARVLHSNADAHFDQFSLVLAPAGLPMAETVVDREQWVRAQTEPLPPYARRETVVARTPQNNDAATVLFQNPRPLFESGVGLGLQQTLGGPDGFILYQFAAIARARLNVRDDTWIQSTLELGLLDNYDKFRYTAPSQLPRVRTYAREFATTSDLRLPNLQLTHVGRAQDDHFYSLYGGLLESMYAGVGGEWLYRPFASRIAFGLDANVVQQRDFDQHFSLRDYRVSTGHATLYWDTGWNDVRFQLSAGKYLAGDQGATLDFSRGFENGVRMGAYFTKTNVSSAQFGEGSFDKGIYLTIPFDAFLTQRSKNTALFMWRPLTRDGGAKLSRSVTLIELTQSRDLRALDYKPAPPAESEVAPADIPFEKLPPKTEPAEQAHLTPRPAPGEPVDDKALQRRLAGALAYQGFDNILIATTTPHRIEVGLSSRSIRPASRAAHRAALTLLRHAPLDTRAIHIQLAEHNQPAVAYEFFDLARLDDFYSGIIDETTLRQYVATRVLHPNSANTAPMARFNDLARADDTQSLPGAIAEDLTPIRRMGHDIVLATRFTADIDWTTSLATGGAILLSARAFDERTDRFMKQHRSSRLDTLARGANALPLLMTGAAAATALLTTDPQLERTSYSATEAAAAALVLSTGLKQLTHRTRPDNSGKDAFPSNHAAVAWAVVTPYAREYNAPWLYAAPLLTSFARVQQRRHWVSDVAAGAMLGAGVGLLFHESARREALRPRAYLTAQEVGLSWPF